MTGANFKDWALVIVGNLFIVLLAVRSFGSWAKKEWGELIALLVGAVVVAAAIYVPQQVITVLTHSWSLFNS